MERIKQTPQKPKTIRRKQIIFANIYKCALTKIELSEKKIVMIRPNKIKQRHGIIEINNTR